MNELEKKIAHVGVLGMKWGRRKSRTSSSDHTSAKQLSKKRLHQMSNEELKKLNTRMQLERTYKDLAKSSISPGQKLFSEIILSAGKSTMSSYTSKAMTSGIDTLLKYK